MFPEIIRHDSLSLGLMGSHRLVDGIYLIKVALARDFSDNSLRGDMYVNSWEQLIEVTGGVVVAPLHFELEDLTLMGSRARLLIQLFTVNEQLVKFHSTGHIDQEGSLKDPNLIDFHSNLKIKTFTGPFIPKFEGQGPNLIESKISANEFIKKGKKWLLQKEAEYAKDHRLSVYDKKFRLQNYRFNNSKHLNWLTHGSEIFEDDLELMKKYMAQGTLNPELRSHLGRRLCSYWFMKHIPKVLKNSHSPEVKDVSISFNRARAYLYELCQESESKGQEFFSFDNKILVNEVDPKATKYMGGSSFNFNVSAGFDLSKGEGWDISTSHSSAESFSAGIGGDVLPFVSLKAGKTTTWSASEGHSNRMSRGARLAYGAGAYLVIQHSTFRLNVTEYERCLIIKPRWKLIKTFMERNVLQEPEDKSWMHKFKTYFKPKDIEAAEKISSLTDLYDSQLYLDIANSGVRLCSGENQNRPLSLTEDYFYVAQHFTSGDLHDPAELRNRPWLMSIRSLRDFRVFIESIHNHNRMTDVGRHKGTVPNEILAEAYSDYNEKQPSWPGLYSYYPYDQRQIEDCQRNRSALDTIIQEGKEIIGGVRAKMDGRHKDFWPIYHCPQD